MSTFSELDMLYDYDKDVAAAATGFMTFATKASNQTLGHRYLQLANEAGKVSEEVRKLIVKAGGIS